MKVLSYIFLFLLSSVSYAQITYSSADFLNEGDTVRISQTSSGLLGLNVSASGSNVNWDFSSLTSSSQELKTFYPNTESSYKLSWCFINTYVFNCTQKFNELTNMLEKSTQEVNVGSYNFQNVQYHYNKSDSGFAQTLFGFAPGMGALNIPVAVEYTHHDTMFHFPLYMGRQDSSYGELNIDLSASNIPLARKTITIRESEVDAWGSLSTPYGTFENTLRLKTNITIIDSLHLDSILVPISRKEVEYLWFAEDYSYPVFKAKGHLVFGLPIISKVEYLDSLRCLPPDARFAFWPLLPVLDSATHHVNINTFNLSNSADTYQWNIEGVGSSADEQPSFDFACAGTYSIRLIASNSCNPVLKDTFNLPIIIAESPLNIDIDTLSFEKCPSDSLLVYDNYYSEAGHYPYHTTSSFGCDSIVMLKIEDKAIDLTINQLGDSLVSGQESAVYQWINCEDLQEIEGATDFFYQPTENGNYAVRVTFNSCTEQSDCVNYDVDNIQERLKLSNIKVYPNPFNNSYFSVNSKLPMRKIRIFSSNGLILKSIDIDSQISYTVNFEAKDGVYILEVEDVDGNKYRNKILKSVN